MFSTQPFWKAVAKTDAENNWSGIKAGSEKELSAGQHKYL